MGLEVATSSPFDDPIVPLSIGGFFHLHRRHYSSLGRGPHDAKRTISCAPSIRELGGNGRRRLGGVGIKTLHVATDEPYRKDHRTLSRCNPRSSRTRSQRSHVGFYAQAQIRTVGVRAMIFVLRIFTLSSNVDINASSTRLRAYVKFPHMFYFSRVLFRICTDPIPPWYITLWSVSALFFSVSLLRALRSVLIVLKFGFPSHSIPVCPSSAHL